MMRPRTLSLGLVLATFAVNGCFCAEPLQVIPPPPVVPDPVEPDPVAQFGAVQGRVCAPDGETWLVDAHVFIAPAGTDDLLEDTSNEEGRFQIGNVPVGPQVMHIEKGSFSMQRSVTIVADTVVTLPDDECALEHAPRIAVVHGSEFDNVEAVLDEIGIEAETIDVYEDNWATQLLSDDDALAQYDILFLNCRSNEDTYADREDMQERLRDFVAAGGSLHASDQAYDLIEITFPDKINFLGEDDVRGAADEGASVDELEARVLATDLESQLGTDRVPIHYGLSTWSVMVNALSDVEVYLVADAPLIDGGTIEDAPMIVGFDHGEGRVVYSSFHQEPGIGSLQEEVLKLIMFEL